MVVCSENKFKHNLAVFIGGNLFQIFYHGFLVALIVYVATRIAVALAGVYESEFAVAFEEYGIGVVDVEKVNSVIAVGKGKILSSDIKFPLISVAQNNTYDVKEENRNHYCHDYPCGNLFCSLFLCHLQSSEND